MGRQRKQEVNYIKLTLLQTLGTCGHISYLLDVIVS